MLVHIYTGQNMFFIRIKEAFHTVVSPDATVCIALRNRMCWLTPLPALPNVTFRMVKHDLL
ncbi:unknown [Parabacteroides sp. CAG:2]|nr:unknown [Parabacteroides sp. CAG:2]